jgi:hypothetical protein
VDDAGLKSMGHRICLGASPGIFFLPFHVPGDQFKP